MAELNAPPRRPWVGLVVGIGLLVLLLGSCLVLVPAWFLAARPPQRSKQSEVKTNLKVAFTCERSFFSEHDRFDAATASNPKGRAGVGKPCANPP